MTLAAQQPKAEKALLWVFEMELGYRIEGKTWTQDDSPNDSCWYMAHLTEGTPSRVRTMIRSTGVITDHGTVPAANLAALQAAASGWFYDSTTGRLHIHLAANDAPDTASKYYVTSHFWKYFSTDQRPAPNMLYDPLGFFIEPRLGQMATGITQEVNDFTEPGIRETWDHIDIDNADGKYDLLPVTYIVHNCACILKIGAVGDAYANLVTINRGRTGNWAWDDAGWTVGINGSDFD